MFNRCCHCVAVKVKFLCVVLCSVCGLVPMLQFYFGWYYYPTFLCTYSLIADCYGAQKLCSSELLSSLMWACGINPALFTSHNSDVNKDIHITDTNSNCNNAVYICFVHKVLSCCVLSRTAGMKSSHVHLHLASMPNASGSSRRRVINLQTCKLPIPVSHYLVSLFLHLDLTHLFLVDLSQTCFHKCATPVLG